jgi:hypothetical protein
MKYDLHIHTRHSKCSNLKAEVILKRAQKLGLDGIAIADHDTIAGALEVFNKNKNKDFEVIVGEEVTTEKGHILVYYLQKEIKSKSFSDVVDEAKRQGALISLAHPTDFIRFHFSRKDFMIKGIDAIETFNARAIIPWANITAKSLAKKLGLGVTGGSDAHFWFEIGKAITIFEDDLKKAIVKRKTLAQGTIIYSYPAHIFTFLRKKIFK